jgi:predicted HD phosphohydrolase
MNTEKENRLAWEFKQQRRRDTPGTWEYRIAKAEENNQCCRVAERDGMTSETWPPP